MPISAVRYFNVAGLSHAQLAVIMASDLIKQLLVLQEADTRAAELERDLKRIPPEILMLEGRIESEKIRLQETENTIKQQEARRKEMDGEVAAIEAKVIKFKTQQLEVRKNEEYEALTHEIEAAQTRISTLEDQELELLMEIDGAREALKLQQDEVKASIAAYQAQIAALRVQEQACLDSIEEAREHYASANSRTEEKARREYENVKRSGKKAPYVVRIKGDTCNGCHLRISNENLAAVKDLSRVVRCDNCGRIVFA